MRTSLIHGKIDINAFLAFVFGVIFLTAMLVFATVIPNPSEFSQWVFVVVTSLAGAGIGAVIPGILKITLPYARAGGALAIFLLVFLNKPVLVKSVANFVRPEYSSQAAALEYLSKIDDNQIAIAWDLLDPRAKATIAKDRELYEETYNGGRLPYGEVESRALIGSGEFVSPPGMPQGIYQSIRFKTHFETGGCRDEIVKSRAADEKTWRVFDHYVSPQPIPC